MCDWGRELAGRLPISPSPRCRPRDSMHIGNICPTYHDAAIMAGETCPSTGASSIDFQQPLSTLLSRHSSLVLSPTCRIKANLDPDPDSTPSSKQAQSIQITMNGIVDKEAARRQWLADLERQSNEQRQRKLAEKLERRNITAVLAGVRDSVSPLVEAHIHVVSNPSASSPPTDFFWSKRRWGGGGEPRAYSTNIQHVCSPSAEQPSAAAEAPRPSINANDRTDREKTANEDQVPPKAATEVPAPSPPAMPQQNVYGRKRSLFAGDDLDHEKRRKEALEIQRYREAQVEEKRKKQEEERRKLKEQEGREVFQGESGQNRPELGAQAGSDQSLEAPMGLRDPVDTRTEGAKSAQVIQSKIPRPEASAESNLSCRPLRDPVEPSETPPKSQGSLPAPKGPSTADHQSHHNSLDGHGHASAKDDQKQGKRKKPKQGLCVTRPGISGAKHHQSGTRKGQTGASSGPSSRSTVRTIKDKVTPDRPQARPSQAANSNDTTPSQQHSAHEALSLVQKRHQNTESKIRLHGIQNQDHSDALDDAPNESVHKTQTPTKVKRALSQIPKLRTFKPVPGTAGRTSNERSSGNPERTSIQVVEMPQAPPSQHTSDLGHDSDENAHESIEHSGPTTRVSDAASQSAQAFTKNKKPLQPIEPRSERSPPLESRLLAGSCGNTSHEAIAQRDLDSNDPMQSTPIEPLPRICADAEVPSAHHTLRSADPSELLECGTGSSTGIDHRPEMAVGEQHGACSRRRQRHKRTPMALPPNPPYSGEGTCGGPIPSQPAPDIPSWPHGYADSLPSPELMKESYQDLYDGSQRLASQNTSPTHPTSHMDEKQVLLTALLSFGQRLKREDHRLYE
ncbi:uncharacterized protein BJ171DRAFT_493935 [Polychytrium aggregatum]|uniref:uncharacterized protein n=1 Tax=Polychytrium aggregatum TaxID=110093 RepID=UPI0022FDDF95|nr:uncharacterized protein BJ171DRAFT_493935 [Polychytrium aggregatum]KAI9207221.1 hypothetical protein BJ171DRAFT_493935 [Polychytrium aggregatum]